MNLALASNRATVARAIAVAAAPHGATTTVRLDGRTLTVTATHPSGLSVLIWLRPEDSGRGFLLHWNSNRRLNPAAGFHRLNEFHGRKATHDPLTLDALAADVARGFAAAADGSAYFD